VGGDRGDRHLDRQMTPNPLPLQSNEKSYSPLALLIEDDKQSFKQN